MMSEGDGHSGIGKTMWRWDDDVHRVVRRILSHFSAVSCNTYSCHPFCGPRGNRQGWAHRSIDVWAAAGRGHPLDAHLSELVLDFAFTMPGRPLLRHYILEHTLWTSFGGYSRWPYNDHAGNLRHVHLTYWPVPPLP